MSEENKNKEEFVCELVGNERLRETRQAREILDNARVPYRFCHEEAPRYGLHLCYGGLRECLGLDQICRFAKRYKLRHSKNQQTPKGELLVVPAGEKLARNEGFMDALLRFQYGTAEESDKGFEDLKRIAEEGDLEKETRSEN